MPSGKTGIGSRKHAKSGHPDHNRDMVQIAREINQRDEEKKAVARKKRELAFDSVPKLFATVKRKRKTKR